MKKRAKEYYFGCTLILVLLKESIQQKKHECKIFTENDLLHADCKDENLDEVPQDLDTLIRYLDLSRNSLKTLSESSFTRYPIIISLVMRFIKVSFHPDYYLFRKLTLLEILDISGSTFGEKTVFFYWPPSLKELKLSYLDNMHMADVSNLGKLEKLEIDHTPIFLFPVLKRFAPITFINLNSTIINTMRAEDLAPLCHIERLEVSFHPQAGLRTAAKFCECTRLKTWIETYYIQTDGIQCRNLPTECDLSFSDETFFLRNECFSKAGGRSIFFYLGIIFVVVLIIGAAVYLFIRKRREMIAMNNNAAE